MMTQEHPKLVAAMETWEKKTMSKSTKSIPRSLMLFKLGGEKNLQDALTNGEIMELQPPAGCRTPYYAWCSFKAQEQKGLLKKRSLAGSQAMTAEETTQIEDAMMSLEVNLDVKGKEKSALTDDSLNCLSESLKAGNTLVSAASSQVMALEGEDCWVSCQ